MTDLQNILATAVAANRDAEDALRELSDTEIEMLTTAELLLLRRLATNAKYAWSLASEVDVRRDDLILEAIGDQQVHYRSEAQDLG